VARVDKSAPKKVSFGVRKTGRAKKKLGPKEKLGYKKYNRQGR
jgi:hypothetical protein